MVNSVQPVTGKRVETSRIEPAQQDRSALASGQIPGPAAPPAAAAPATIVQLSDAVFARQRGVTSGKGGKDDRSERRIASSDDAKVEAARTRATLLGDRVAAAAAHQASTPDRVFALVFE